MFVNTVEKIIPETNIICVSPHYDDFLFFLGGYVLEMTRLKLLETKRFTNINTFSRSNYQARDVAGNRDRSLERVKHASGIRYIEDLQCLDDLLGLRQYVYRVMGEEESLVRGMALNEGDGEMEMSFGSYDVMTPQDWDVLNRMEACLTELAVVSDTAIVLPLSMKGHIDHFIVREAGLRALQNTDKAKTKKAAFYFAEDKPYAGIMTEKEAAENDAFIAAHPLKPYTFRGHPQEMIRLAYAHYPSQVDTIYDEGILTRSQELKNIHKVEVDCDRIYKYEEL